MIILNQGEINDDLQLNPPTKQNPNVNREIPVEAVSDELAIAFFIQNSDTESVYEGESSDSETDIGEDLSAEEQDADLIAGQRYTQFIALLPTKGTIGQTWAFPQKKALKEFKGCHKFKQ